MDSFTGRNTFLGTSDLSVTFPLMTNYDVPTKRPDDTYLHTITQQEDLVLLQLGSLLAAEECDDLVHRLESKAFQDLSKDYDASMRTNSRLIVFDDRLGRTLWRRLKFAHRLPNLVQNTRPLGFNVQGRWKMSGINPAMRINQYKAQQFFSPHKDGQYAPSGDERSLLSLLIYLNDGYDGGETKFYFPKVKPRVDVKGLSIKEEIDAYHGLKQGYECISVKPKKGHAVLFTHHLLHEAMPPILPTSSQCSERLVLRTDVLVKRQEKPLGFAICDEERDDYLACLNYFREAQQLELNRQHSEISPRDIGELYERSLSIRYCYPRLLNPKMARKRSENKDMLIMTDKLPAETWLHIWNYLHERDVQNFIFAYPNFQSLKVIWQARELQSIQHDTSKAKFIPTIETRYGCQTLFRFPDAQFFDDHLEQCCRVAAIYAFFVLGNSVHSKHYVVRFNRDTEEVCEVEMEKLFSDVFYNRHCYGSLYRVRQQDNEKRRPTTDINNSIDRSHMINRHQCQFIGTDIKSKFHFRLEKSKEASSDFEDDDEMDWRRSSIGYRDVKGCDTSLKDELIQNSSFNIVDVHQVAHSQSKRPTGNRELKYSHGLFEQHSRTYGSSAARMCVANGEAIAQHCCCFGTTEYRMHLMDEHLETYNHLIFDFDTHRMAVEQQSGEKLFDRDYSRLLTNTMRNVRTSLDMTNSKISHYRVNLEKLTEQTDGFNHASCNCFRPRLDIDEFSFLDYTYLTHVDLAIIRQPDHVLVLAVYGGIAAL